MTYPVPPPEHEPTGGWPPPQPVSGQPYPAYGQPPPPGWPPAPRKRWGPGKIIALVAGIVVLVCVSGVAVIAVTAAGSRDTAVATFDTPAASDPATPTAKKPAATPSPDTFNLPAGATLTVTDDNGDVQEVTVLSVKVHDGGCGRDAPDPDNGSYVIADVRAVQKKGTGEINPLFFTYVADDGTTANAFSGAFSGCGRNALGSTNDLRAGAKRAGQIVFDAPAGAGTIEFESGGWGGDAAGSWQVG